MQVKEGPEQEVYVTFSPRFERIWLESKKRLPDYMDQKPGNAGLRSQYALRLYGWAKKYGGRSQDNFAGGALPRVWPGVGQGPRMEMSLRKRPCQSGRTSSNGRLTSRLRRLRRKQT